MKNITNFARGFFKSIGKDKLVHFTLGSSFSLVVLPLLVIVKLSLLIEVGIFIALMVAFAWSIEFYQKLTNTGQYDNRDAVAVIIGGIPVALAYIAGIYSG